MSADLIKPPLISREESEGTEERGATKTNVVGTVQATTTTLNVMPAVVAVAWTGNGQIGQVGCPNR